MASGDSWPRSAGLVVVDIDSLQLQVRLPSVGPLRVDAVLVRDRLPELKRIQMKACRPDNYLLC